MGSYRGSNTYEFFTQFYQKITKNVKADFTARQYSNLLLDWRIYGVAYF